MALVNPYVSVITDNYSKCKCIEFMRQKAQSDWMDEKLRFNYVLPTRDSFQFEGHS